MERIKLDNSTTISITPVGATTAVVVPLSKVINAIEASDAKFIRIDGKVYTHDEIDQGISDIGNLGVQKFSGGSKVNIEYKRLVTAIKTFGLQFILKVSYDATLLIPTVYVDEYFKTTTLEII
jgi:hypothetical protein